MEMTSVKPMTRDHFSAIRRFLQGSQAVPTCAGADHPQQWRRAPSLTTGIRFDNGFVKPLERVSTASISEVSLQQTTPDPSPCCSDSGCCHRHPAKY